MNRQTNMTLYIDNAKIPYGRVKMSHMIADSPKELRRASAALGLKHSYVQHPETSREHLDISLVKRENVVRKLVPEPFEYVILPIATRRSREGGNPGVGAGSTWQN